MKTDTRFTFPVASFRHIYTPSDKLGYRSYVAVVDAQHLPDLAGWRKINVRDPKLTGAVPKAIRESTREYTELFVFLNRGIVLAVSGVTFNNKNSEVTIALQDPDLHGLLDGGHTYNILLEERDSVGDTPFVKLELLDGFKQDEIPILVDARE